MGPALAGDPPVLRHAVDPHYDITNFSIEQDRSGVVYLGNAQGVLSFDGERWTLIPLTNGDMVRSLRVGPDDRVWVGGYGVLGHLQYDAAGAARFVDLTPQVRGFLQGRELADIWQIELADHGVYFRAVRDLFFLDTHTGAFQHWHHPERFGELQVQSQRTVVQFRGEGFRQRSGDEWIPLAETAGLTELVFGLTELPDGSLLTRGVNGQWWRWTDDHLQIQPMPAALPPSSNFQHALLLADGGLALVGSDGALYLLDAGLSQMRRLQLAAGFLSGICAAQGGGVLVVTDEAFFFVDWPSDWTVIGPPQGIAGDLAGVVHWRGFEYVLGSAGISRVEAGANGVTHLRALDWPAQSVHALTALDERRALLADDHWLWLVEDEQLQLLSEQQVYPREFYPSRFRPGRTYIGTELGLRYVDAEPSGQQSNIQSDLPRLSPPFLDPREIRVQGVVETSAEELWFGSLRHGLWRVRLDASGQFLSAAEVPLPSADQAVAQAPVFVTELADGRPKVSTVSGIYLLQDGALLPEPDGAPPPVALHQQQPRPVWQLAQSSDGARWAYGNGGVYRRPQGGQWQEQSVQSLRRGRFLGHRIEAAGGITLISSQQLLRYQPLQYGSVVHQAPQLRLRSVHLQQADGRRDALPVHSPDADQHELQLLQGEHALSFHFALPELSQAQASRYQGRLLGYEEQWSEWSRAHSYSYSRLRPGQYQLEVRARDVRGRISTIEPYRLTVLPPWYRSGWAWLTALCLAASALVWMVRRFVQRRLARLAADKAVLERQVAERTLDLASANQRLLTMAHQDGLTGIANRRRLDAELQSCWQGALQDQQPLAVLAIDVDHFKRYNDSHGHLAGDELLKQLARILERTLDPQSQRALLARFGGEEFMVVLPGCDLPSALVQAEQLRDAVDRAGIGATVSIGCASVVPDASGTLAALLTAADRALYVAKNSGRNQIASN